VNRIMEARNNPSVERTLLRNPDLFKLIDEHFKGPMLLRLHGM
jgi:hypothetical protein